MEIKEIFFIFLILIIESVFGNTMFYKRNNHDKLEPDLIPISSTVIPLSVYEVSYGLDGKPNEEYKVALLKKLRKKVKHMAEYEDPDTLITLKKLKHENKGKTKDKHN